MHSKGIGNHYLLGREYLPASRPVDRQTSYHITHSSEYHGLWLLSVTSLRLQMQKYDYNRGIGRSGNCRLFVLLKVTRDELSHQITIVIETFVLYRNSHPNSRTQSKLGTAWSKTKDNNI